MRRRRTPRPARIRGVGAIETLLAIPIVLLLGLGGLQWALVFHARQAIAYAALEAGRAGSVDHASDLAIERGLARGLMPWMHGSTGPEDHRVNLARSEADLREGLRLGWAQWRRLAPTVASFADWSEPARDVRGDPVPGQREIPNDNLSLRVGMRQPASGVQGWRAGEPIGHASGQTLADANLLKLEFIWGVPLTVPLVGRLAAWIMAGVDRCGALPARRLGLVDLGRPDAGLSRADIPDRAWTCGYYAATNAQGQPRPRWPVRVSATVRMQSPARTSAAAPAPGAQFGPSLGLGVFDPSIPDRPPPLQRINPGGAGPTEDGSIDRAPGFLRIGAERLLPPPPACPQAPAPAS